MCGIIGYCGHRPAVPLVIEGLSRLEYRGYDSSGIAYLQAKKLETIRAAGKLCMLENKLVKTSNVLATIAIGHTRWATHGLPLEKNAHPHKSQNNAVAIIHNGIIENFQEIKDDLISKGYVFNSDTDTEVLANLISFELDILLAHHFLENPKFASNEDFHIENAQNSESVYREILEKAFGNALKKAQGAYALVLLSPLIPHHILAARLAAPLLLGIGVGEFFVASDVPAFLPYTKDVIFLEDREIALISANFYQVKNLDTAHIVEKKVSHIPWDIQSAAKDGHKHFMIKEIMEQPKVLRDCLMGRLVDNKVVFPELDHVQFNRTKGALNLPSRIRIIACGTSYNAGFWSQSYFENISAIPVSIEIASEFRYRKPILDKNECIIVISQSGETADTLGALRLCKNMGHTVLGICNVLGSSLAREADHVLYTQAGPEISVASTKAMLSQMVLLLLFAMYLGQEQDSTLLPDTAEKERQKISQELLKLSAILEENLPKMREKAKILAKKYAFARSFFYLGRATAYALAIEGALKLKELSYIHAEAYASGEMKHGPIALIEPDFPSLVIAFDDEHLKKVHSAILEIESRQGKVIVLLQEDTFMESEDIWYIPKTCLPEFLALPAMQLFSYEMADYLGKDVDQPRNLAKSVTVE